MGFRFWKRVASPRMEVEWVVWSPFVSLIPSIKCSGFAKAFAARGGGFVVNSTVELEAL